MMFGILEPSPAKLETPLVCQQLTMELSLGVQRSSA